MTPEQRVILVPVALLSRPSAFPADIDVSELRRLLRELVSAHRCPPA